MTTRDRNRTRRIVVLISCLAVVLFIIYHNIDHFLNVIKEEKNNAGPTMDKPTAKINCAKSDPSRKWPYRKYLPNNYTPHYKYWNYTAHQYNELVLHSSIKQQKLTSLEILERIIHQSLEENEEMLSKCYQANLTRSYELVRKYNQSCAKLGGPSFPILNVGFPKSGTSSLHSYFKCAGYKSRHSEAGTCMHKVFDDIEGNKTKSPLDYQCVGNNMIATQLDSSRKGQCYWPQITLLDEIHHSVPNATFVLLFRDVRDWIRSINQWGTLRKRLNMCHLRSLVKQDLLTDNELKMWWCRHITHIREFVDQYPSHELIELEIYNKNVTSNILTSLFGGSESCWGRSNAKASLTKKTNNTN